ncbi:hypothetical protein CWB41_13790 [Methylovirgula ligni]|uniref:hypothetical protein n=1 Tax=Methylovirgula ligni TaxID=569860 RepID=UPI000E23A873|nr:hypothetical protein [Methylovirgula ligni]QAY96666.1 hypothetical protein CWB41_13790 [Methylovirgula ligni]
MLDLCATYNARLATWLDAGDRPRVFYDGTIGSLCDLFEAHSESPIHEVKGNTAESYIDSLKVIRATVARRAVRALVPVDVKGWYRRWRMPAKPGSKPRIKRAHDAVAAVRMVLRFGASLGYKDCGELAEGLKAIRFERAPPRESEMTFEQAKAFVETALARGDKRGLYMAIGTAAQFETMLRQKDVIGEWGADEAGREIWDGRFTWENIPGGILRLKTSKRSKKGEFDLTTYELLWPLMQMVPQAERVGAIVKGEHDLPIRERSYRTWFRAIARDAGIPDEVWNMDSRAGAVTEALESGADETDVSRAATHSGVVITRRYDRQMRTAVANVAEARKRGRGEN